MAREADLPRWLAAVHPRFKVPHRAELVLAAVICLVISIADLRGPSVFPPRGPDLLPRRQPRRFYPDPRKPPLPQGPAATRRRCLRCPGCDAAGGIRDRGTSHVRGWNPVPHPAVSFWNHSEALANWSRRRGSPDRQAQQVVLVQVRESIASAERSSLRGSAMPRQSSWPWSPPPGGSRRPEPGNPDGRCRHNSGDSGPSRAVPAPRGGWPAAT
jgi:hypothetical protein